MSLAKAVKFVLLEGVSPTAIFAGFRYERNFPGPNKRVYPKKDKQ